MEPSVTTSFIPKKPISSSIEPSKHLGRSVGLLSLLTFVIAAGTIVAFVGVFLYQKQLVSQKSKLEQSISEAKDGIGTDFVADMSRLNARISGVKDIIKNHIVITPIFKSLEVSTLRSIQYKSLGYSITADSLNKGSQTVVVDIVGTAKNYGTIALQSDAFSTNTLIKNPVFSNLTIDEKNRTVNFKLTFNVSLSDLSYQGFIDSMTSKQSAPISPVAPTPIPLEDNNPTP
ncbi:MAG: hypothetical protein KBC11_02485 [Candidatus Pacebacteria bacterium]|nr:hypothetical protein [Candidatus Paceibacterota bacterium]